MEDLFDRNVHPLYAVMAFVSAAIVLILLLNYLLNNRKGKKQELLGFFGFIIFYCIQDGIWGLLASGMINSDSGLMLASAVFHFSSALAPLIWTLFFCKSLRDLIQTPKIWISVASVLMLVQLGMILANFSSHFMFYVDETGNYQTTNARAILFYLQFFIYLLVAAVSIFGILSTKTQTRRSSFQSFLWISLAPVFFDVFQLIYPDAPANSVGLCIACVLVQTFLTQTVETQVRELEAEAELQKSKQKEILSAGVITTLSLEYGPLYLADLQTGSLQVFRTSEMETSISVQRLAAEIPEYLPFIREYAARYVAEEDRASFLEWTNTEHLKSIITANNISEFNYQRNMNGMQNYYQFCCGRVSDDPGNNLMIFGFRNVDAAVKKDMETKRTLEAALKDANIANKAKTQFLFNMSHDIRTPMNAIIGYTGIAKRGTKEPATKDYLGKIEIAGNQLLSLVNQVLEMARIESGTIVLQEQKIDMEQSAEVVRTIYTSQAEAKGLRFVVDLRGLTHRHVIGDSDRVSQIVNNLLGNSIKYTPEGGSIFNYVEEEPCDKPGYAVYRITVEDTGIGMSRDFLPHLFEEFSRENTSTVSKIQGTGLGMPIVKRLTELMGGSIEVTSELGQGSKFVVRIPLKIDADFKEAEPGKENNPEISLAGMKILLVEDNEMNREIAEEILEEYGAKIDTAEDGDIAVEKLKNSVPGQYDVVLMDIQMPRMNGYEAARAIRTLKNKEIANIKIIAMTANAFEEDRQNAFAAGMNEHIAKPIDVPKLLGTLASLYSAESIENSVR